ncbi:M23 family peptidase, partial [Clavibacter michiganensis subsp. michiganensis]|nr:M23 family peptidase [Clavibacter michiganensis subsp. michiganensis]
MLTPDETAGTVYPTRRERREAERRAAEAPEAQESPLDDSVAQPAAEPAQLA